MCAGITARTGRANAGVLLLLAGCVAEPALYGPMPVRNQHPAQLIVQHMDPAGAAVLGPGEVAGRTSLAYTSLFLLGVSDDATWIMDGEYLRSSARLRLGLGAGLELETQIAAAHTSGGFLDDFLIDYHRTFGFPDQDRNRYQTDSYSVRATQGGDEVWSVDRASAELLDLPLQLSWQVLDPATGFGAALRGGLELPTGDARRGFGNGGLDASVGALFEWHPGTVGCFGHAQHTFAATPGFVQDRGLRFQDVTSAGLGAELPLASNLAALVQVEFETSTLRRLGPLVTSRNQLLLWVGGRWLPTPHWGVEVGFGEDLRGLVSPDFTAWLSFVYLP